MYQSHVRIISLFQKTRRTARCWEFLFSFPSVLQSKHEIHTPQLKLTSQVNSLQRTTYQTAHKSLYLPLSRLLQVAVLLGSTFPGALKRLNSSRVLHLAPKLKLTSGNKFNKWFETKPPRTISGVAIFRQQSNKSNGELRSQQLLFPS